VPVPLLCGHGTLAAAHALWETRRLALDATARFTTGAGTLAAARRDGWISLDFPAEPATRTRAPVGLTGRRGDGLGALLSRPLWGERLGRSELVGLQVSARGGVVRVALAGERVRLAGQAVTVSRGELA